MFIKDNLNLSHENNLLLQYKNHKIIHFKPRIGFMFVFVLMMSLMFVEVHSSNQYRNQSTATIRARRVKGYNRNSQLITNITTTSSTTIVTKSELIKQTPKRKASSDKHTKVKTTSTKKPTPEKTKKINKRKPTRDSTTRRRMRADMHQYQYRERQRPHQQQTQQHASAGETAFLVERDDDDNAEDEQQSVREHQQQQQQQAIYGTWRTKAKRPQAPLTANALAHLATATKQHSITNELNASAIAASAPITSTPTTISIQNNAAAENDYHVYERLPRRSATMTPLRNDLHDQLPRPPRLTSRRPSLLVRRQYLDTPMNASYAEFEQKPKPFHFAFDGPLPAEFKKAQPERTELNNIQEILQQLQLNSLTPAATRSPQLVMLPTGLHVAGSFKNFKSSGIANFFRNKRNKKQVQLSLPFQFQPVAVPKPLPLQYYNNYQPALYGAAAQPYQRIAMDQFYAFKPRSPGEINLLAMQQQLNAQRVKNKKKKTASQAANAGLYSTNGNNNLLVQQNNQRPDHFVPYYPPQWLVLNATQNPKLKRIPFKVNLDIFPVLPPTKTALPQRNPFVDYGGYQYSHVLPQQQQLFNEANYMRLPVTHQQQHQQQQHHQHQQQQQQPSSAHIIFPDQIPKYTQQFPVQHEPYQRPPLNPQQNTFSPIDFDCIDPPSNENAPPNSNGNQIMLHLNVFPKPRTTVATPLPSTNPFYSNQLANNINRNTAHEATDATTQLTQDTRNLSRQTAYANDTVQQFYPKPQRRISRSDDTYAALVDFEHPIVAADVLELPQSATLVSNKLDDTSDISPHYDHIEIRNNLNTNSESNIDQLSSEARAASLFRYPVEDLIQFHVDDAL